MIINLARVESLNPLGNNIKLNDFILNLTKWPMTQKMDIHWARLQGCNCIANLRKKHEE